MSGLKEWFDKFLLENDVSSHKSSRYFPSNKPKVPKNLNEHLRETRKKLKRPGT